ncbi:hypothetical protein BJX99DRAFT_264319 [Aspergillus californicus]
MTDQPRRKRRRPAISCEPCRQRKVRCDLSQPCGPCARAKSSLNCLYRNDEVAANARVILPRSENKDNTQRRALGDGRHILTPTSIGADAGATDDIHQTIHDIQSRLDALEGRLASNATVDVSVRRLSLERNLDFLAEKVRTVEAQLTTTSNAAGILAKDHTSVGAIPPRLRQSTNKVKFMGPTHWCNRMNGLSIAQMLNQKDPEPSLRDLKNEYVKIIKECRDLRRSIKSQRSVKLNDPLPDLRGTVPSRGECDELIHCYLRTFELIYRVIHVQSFWTEYEEFWKQPQSNSGPFVVKLVLILAIGSVFHSGGSPARNEYHQLAQKWIYAAQSWLAGTSERSTVNIDGLQSMCLLLISRKACGLGLSPWLSAGSLMRTAMAMGLHRDPTKFPALSFLQSEIRRRLWATVLELALQDSLDSATPLLVPGNFDTSAPSNVNDRSLDQDTATIPVTEPADRFTDTSIQLLLYESVRLRIHALEVMHEHKNQSYQRALELGSQLTATCRKATAFFLSAKVARTGTGLEPTEFHAKFLDIQLQRYILAVYTPFMVQARNDPQYYYARKACLQSAMAIASYAGTINLPSDTLDEPARLFIKGKGSFKGPLSLDIISLLGLEVVTQLEEECPPCLSGPDRKPGDQLADANRDHLIQTLEHILDQLFQIISSGTPSMKRYGLLAAVLGQIRAIKTGQCDKTAVYEAVTQAFKDCHLALQSSITDTPGLIERSTVDTNMSGDFDLPISTLPGFDMDLANPMIDFEFPELLANPLLVQILDDPVFFDFYGIDPNLLFDDDDRAYIQGFLGRRLINSSRLMSLWAENCQNNGLSGADFSRLILKGQVVSAARSIIWGPYESCQANPILPPAEAILISNRPDTRESSKTIRGVCEREMDGSKYGEVFLTKGSFPMRKPAPTPGEELQVYINGHRTMRLPSSHFFVAAMEIPKEIALKSLKGSWTLDKSVSDDADSILKLQGVGWLTRKAIGAATLTLHFTSDVEASSSSAPTPHLTMRQTLTGGIPGSTEERIMDWVERERSNHIYGDVKSRSRLISGVIEDGAVRPVLTLQSKAQPASIEEEVKTFLRGGTPYTAQTETDYTDLYVHDFGRNEKSGWTAEQIWSIEVINSQQYLTRRVAVVREDGYELARLVYKFSGL